MIPIAIGGSRRSQLAAMRGAGAALPWPLTLRTRRLELRPYRPEDYPAWLAGMSGRLPAQHRYDAGPRRAEDVPRRWFRSLCARHRRLWQQDRCYVFGVFDKKTGKHLGHVDIGIIERARIQRANLGYSIHNTYQRHGYGTEAGTAAIRFAFQKLGLHRLEAVIDPDNQPSRALARRLRLEFEGLRHSFYFDHGRWHDQVVFVAIRGRWPKRSGEAGSTRR